MALNAPYYTKTQVDSKIDPLKVDIQSVENEVIETNERVYNLELEVDGIADGTGGKSYPDLTTAMAVTPLPEDGTIFLIDPDNEEEAGKYKYDSNEPNGWKFLEDLGAKGKVEEGELRAVSGNEVFSTRASKEVENILLGTTNRLSLPYKGFIDETFSTQNSDDAYFFDTRNIVYKGGVVKELKVKVGNFGEISVVVLSESEVVISEDIYEVEEGENTIPLDIIAEEDVIIGIRTNSSFIRLNSSTDGYFRKKSVTTGTVTSINYKLAYEVSVEYFEEGLLPSIEETIEVVLTKNNEETRPFEGYIEQTFNTSTAQTTDIFFDTRNSINPATDKEIKVIVGNRDAGECNVILLSYDYTVLKTISFTAFNGFSEVDIDVSDIEQSFYVAIQPTNSRLRLKSETNTVTFKISSGVLSAVNNYVAGYAIVYKDYSVNLINRVSKLEKDIYHNDFDIFEEILTKDRIYLPPYPITIDKTLNIPDGKEIIGVKGKSVINVAEGVTIGINIGGSDDVVLRNFKLSGVYPDTPTVPGMNPVAPGIVDTYQEAINFENIGMVGGDYKPQTGIRLNGGERIIITGLEITNFSEFGFHVSKTGEKYQYALNFNDNSIHDNYCGIKTDNEAERSFYTDNYVTYNQIGMYIDSGTNDIKGMSLNANRVGLVLSNGWNHAHGLISNIQITHCTLIDLICNEIELGQNFDNCKFGFNESDNNIYLYKSAGINFTNCQLVTRCGIIVDGVNEIRPTYINSFVNCFSNSGNVTVTYENGANTLRLKGNWSMNPDSPFNTNFNN